MLMAQLEINYKHLLGILKMIQNNRSPREVCIQILAANGNAAKSNDMFNDLLCLAIVRESNELLTTPLADDKILSTLHQIRKTAGVDDLMKQVKMLEELDKIKNNLSER